MIPDQAALLNRRISEKRGWHVEEQPHAPGFFRLCKPKPSLTMGPATMFPWKSEIAPNWLTSDEANCVLLDEMKPVDLTSNEKEWFCWQRSLPKMHGVWNADRRTAVALAWCRWQGVSLEGIV